MLSSSGHSSPMTNLFVENNFGHLEIFLEPPFKSVKRTGKKHVKSHLKRLELDLAYQRFRFDHDVLLMHSIPSKRVVGGSNPNPQSEI